MKVKNVSSLGDLEVGVLNWRVVKSGEVVDVTPEQGAALVSQPANWVEVKGSKE